MSLDPSADGGGADPFATWAGPYVLGALSPSDAEAFARHLPGCTSCRASVQDLAALPGLLSRVPTYALADDALQVDGLQIDGLQVDGLQVDAGGAPVGPVPDTLLPALLRSVRSQRRRRRAGGIAAGLVAAAVVAAVAVSVDGPSESPAVQALPSSSSSPLPSGTATRGPVGRLKPLVPTALTITARLTGVDWGTEVDITCAYAAASASPPDDYALVVTDRAGGVEQIGTWTAVPGHDAQLTGVTSLPRAQIASVEVRTVDGTPVARLDPPAS